MVSQSARIPLVPIEGMNDIPRRVERPDHRQMLQSAATAMERHAHAGTLATTEPTTASQCIPHIHGIQSRLLTAVDSQLQWIPEKRRRRTQAVKDVISRARRALCDDNDREHQPLMRLIGGIGSDAPLDQFNYVSELLEMEVISSPPC